MRLGGVDVSPPVDFKTGRGEYMRIQLSVYNICKRWQAARIIDTVGHGIVKYEVLKYSDEGALQFGITEADDDGEYLVLYFEDSKILRYCNTRVDLHHTGG